MQNDFAINAVSFKPSKGWQNNLSKWQKRIYAVFAVFLIPIISFNALAHEPANHFDYEPIWLVPNQGQYNKSVKTTADLGGGRVFFKQNGQVFNWWNSQAIKEMHDGSRPHSDSIQHHAYEVVWEGSNPKASFDYADSANFYLNYFRGNDPAYWASNIFPTKKLTIKSIYPKIDFSYYSQYGLLKADYVIYPGGMPSNLRFKYNHINSIQVNEDGKLVITTAVNTIVEEIPEAYQIIKGKKILVGCKYKMIATNTVGFDFIDGYNKNYPLVIDPILVFSTYCGSTSDSWGFTATYDRDENGYGGGQVFGNGYPVTFGAYQQTFGGIDDIAITKFNPSGTQRIYATYLGGRNTDQPMSLVVNNLNQLIVLSKTKSPNYPVSANAFDRIFNGGFDIVVSILNAAGSQLIGSTYFGGLGDDGNNNGLNDITGKTHYNYADSTRSEVVVDSLNRIYIASCTRSTNLTFPSGAIQPNLGGNQDGLLLRFNPDLSILEWGTYLGGSFDDASLGIALAPNNLVYVTGGTASPNFPVPFGGGGFKPSHQGNTDAFILAIDLVQNTILHGTFYGTSVFNQAFMVQRETNGRIWIVGQTEDSIAVTPNTFTVHDGRQFIACFNPSLSVLEKALHFGNGTLDNSDFPELAPTAFLVDQCGRIYFSGWAGQTNRLFNPQLGISSNFPLSPDAFQQTSNGSSFYLMVLESNAEKLIYGSYLGGNQSQEHVDGGTSRFDARGVIYQVVCAGCGGRSDFPTTANSVSRTNNSANCNLALFKLDFELGAARAAFTATLQGDTICENTIALFNNNSRGASVFIWDFGDGSPPSFQRNPRHLYTSPGNYRVTLIASDTIAGCIRVDTLSKFIRVAPTPVVSIINPATPCIGDTVALLATGASTYQWSSTAVLLGSQGDSASVFIDKLNSTVQVIGISEFGCRDTAIINITGFANDPVILSPDTTICLGDTITIFTKLANGNYANWEWNPNYFINSVASPQPLVSPEKDTTYVVKYSLPAGCGALDSIRIKVVPQVFIETTPDPLVCTGTTVNLQVTGADRYLWSTGQTTDNINVVAVSDMQIYVTGFSFRCRSLQDTINIFIDTVRAGFITTPDTAYAPGSFTFINSSSPNSIPTWYFPPKDTVYSSNIFDRFYNKPGYFDVKLLVKSIERGCLDSVSKRLFVDSVLLILPNAFTPNGNRINDTFYGHFHNFEWVDFSVFDRWGNELYRTTDVEARWDGTLNGELLMSGTYPYLLEGLGKNGQKFKRTGVIHLIR